jgi:hypothetical protein
VELADWDICQHSFRNRDLLGYNVFLDGEEQEFVEIREYTFLNVVGEHEAGVQAVYDNGVSEIVTIDFDHTANDGQLPLVTALRRVYPNPFNPETRIEFSLEQNVQVTVEVFNIKGQKVADLIDETLPAGNHDLTWQAQNLPTGVYFLKIKAGEYMKMEKLLLLK